MPFRFDFPPRNPLEDAVCTIENLGVHVVLFQRFHHQLLAKHMVPIHGFGGNARHLYRLKLEKRVALALGRLLAPAEPDICHRAKLAKELLHLFLEEAMRQMTDVQYIRLSVLGSPDLDVWRHPRLGLLGLLHLGGMQLARCSMRLCVRRRRRPCRRGCRPFLHHHDAQIYVSIYRESSA